jgi:hypothetical protein
VSALQVFPSHFINSRFGNRVFFLITFITALVMKACFRAIAAWFTDPTPAQAVSGVTLLVLGLYTGYNIPEPYMIGALRWITYINVCISCHSLYCDIDNYFFLSR